MPGLDWVERSRQNKDANRFLGELFETLDKGQSGRQAAFGLDKGISREEQKIDAPLEGDTDKPLEGGPRCILDNRRDSRR